MREGWRDGWVVDSVLDDSKGEGSLLNFFNSCTLFQYSKLPTPLTQSINQPEQISHSVSTFVLTNTQSHAVPNAMQ